jgi:hypothetical protein
MIDLMRQKIGYWLTEKRMKIQKHSVSIGKGKKKNIGERVKVVNETGAAAMFNEQEGVITGFNHMGDVEIRLDNGWNCVLLPSSVEVI